MRSLIVAVLLIAPAATADAQVASQRGFVEARGFLFREAVPRDPERRVGDVLLREEVFLGPDWLQFAAGLDLRANSHDQVEDEWRLDLEDRSILRPRASLRRLTATIAGGGFSLEVGKQFIRWARTDVLNPIDRFAPRDYLNVIDSEFLPVIAARPSLEIGSEMFEIVWVPQLTPSRMPLLDQRWTVLPANAAGLTIVDNGFRFPDRARREQYGARWRHSGGSLEAGLAYFEGYNHLPRLDVRLVDGTPDVLLTRVFPRLRMYAAEFAVPTGWFTLKGEGGYFTSPDGEYEDYGLYVAELERQVGEWLFTAGYAGEFTRRGGAEPLAFDPERSIAPALLGRVAYTVDPRRTVAIEGAVREKGEGVYVKGDYSQAVGSYFRVTVTGVVLAGDPDDFLGQFEPNSHLSAALRFSF